MDLTVIYRIFHPITKEYTFYRAAHESFSKTNHIEQTFKNSKRLKSLLTSYLSTNAMKIKMSS